MSVRVKEITDCLESIAPLSWQESYDNAGLIVGNKDMECTGVLVCLDVFASTIQEAIDKGCNMVVSHHPFVFRAMKKFADNSETVQILNLAIKNDIAIYATHTNMDSASTGVNFMLANALGLTNISKLQSEDHSEAGYLGCGAVGELKQKTRARDFLLEVKKKLNLDAIRYIGDLDKEIRKIGICGGSGAGFMDYAIEKECDCYLTGDIKYHEFLSSESRIILADIGHYESEQFIKQRIIEIISKNFSNFARLFDSEQRNRVKFI